MVKQVTFLQRLLVDIDVISGPAICTRSSNSLIRKVVSQIKQPIIIIYFYKKFVALEQSLRKESFTDHSRYLQCFVSTAT